MYNCNDFFWISFIWRILFLCHLGFILEFSAMGIGQLRRVAFVSSTWKLANLTKSTFPVPHCNQGRGGHYGLFWKKMNIFWMYILDFKKIIFFNEYSRFSENEYLFWMNTLDSKKWIILLNIYILVLVCKNGCCKMSQTHLKSFRDH